MKKTKEQRRADRKRKEEARARTRKPRAPRPVVDLGGSQLDRANLLELSQTQIARALGYATETDVVAVVDSRDPLGRRMVLKYAAITEEELQEKEAPIHAADLVPTFHLVVPRADAVELSRERDPRVSGAVAREELPGDQRFVLVFAADGVMLTRRKAPPPPPEEGEEEEAETETG